MKIPLLILDKKAILFELCEKHEVDRLYAFGSIVTNHFNSDSSDIDLIVEMKTLPPLIKGQLLISLWESLETLFQRKVDLISQTIKNPYLLASIENTKQLIYDSKSEKISV